MSLSRPGLIPSLVKTGKKTLAKHRESSQSFLANGLVGRTFNAFPSLVTDSQVEHLEKIINSIVRLQESSSGPFHLIDPRDKKAIRQWYLSVARDACFQMLDGYGQIKWALIDILGWENYANCYTEQGVNQLIYSYVHTVFQQASQRAAATIRLKTFEFSALGIYFNEMADSLSLQVKTKTQVEDQRSRMSILRYLVRDYESTIKRIDDASSFFSKLFSGDQDKERLIEQKIIRRCLADKITELSNLFLEMRLNCEEQGISAGTLSRVLKHYTNKLYSFKFNTKTSVSTTNMTHRLHQSLHAYPKLTLVMNEMTESKVEKKSEDHSESILEEDESAYVIIKSEEAKESENYKMTRLAWWMSFFVNLTLTDPASSQLNSIEYAKESTKHKSA